MICIIALVVFGFMSIFSARYRPFTKESFRCFFRLVSLKPCDTGFDEKIKSAIAGKLITNHPRLAGFVFRNFKVISWIFTIIFFVSLGLLILTTYNYFVNGTCDLFVGT